MPELAEVEVGRKLLEEVAVGREIVRVRCADDRIVFEGAAPRTVARRLRGRRITAACRWGKYLWLQLDARPWPVFHFGMTGAFVVPHQRPLQLASSPRVRSDAWPPRFWKIHLHLDDGAQLCMTNARRLGRIRLVDDPKAEPPIANLGFDPLLAMPTATGFRSLVKRRSGILKGVLLDQSFAAGVGNWIADEALYQAALDPRRSANDLSDDEIEALRRALRTVVRTAVAADARSDRFPPGWLFHRRWRKNADATTIDGHPIEHITIAGRTSAWVPAVQR